MTVPLRNKGVGLLNFSNEDFLHRKGGQMDPYLDLDKIFDPSNGGMIEMVQLPDIFLDHPTVSVTVCYQTVIKVDDKYQCFSLGVRQRDGYLRR